MHLRKETCSCIGKYGEGVLNPAVLRRWSMWCPGLLGQHRETSGPIALFVAATSQLYMTTSTGDKGKGKHTDMLGVNTDVYKPTAAYEQWTLSTSFCFLEKPPRPAPP